VHGEVVRAGLRERLDEVLGPDDHEVRVERKPRHLSDRCDEGGSHREVRDEVAVHHVDVEQVCPGRLGRADLITEAVESRAQDRRRDLDGHPRAEWGPSG